MTIKIITDSCCDLSAELVEQLEIEVIPVLVVNGDKEYRDYIDIQPKTVYDGMRKGKIFKTAQITPIIFEEYFKKYAKEQTPAIYLGFSSQLSSTFQSSILAKRSLLEKYPDLDIEVIDTKAASGGLGLIVYEVARAAQNGATKEELLKLIEHYIDNMDHIVTVDDIEYLYRGGRVSRTTAVLGGMLNIKPILEMNQGKLIPIDKVRGRAKALKRMLELMEERNIDDNFKDRTIFIYHGDDIKNAEKLRDMVIEKYDVKEIKTGVIGAVIGAHSGPGTLCIFYSKKNEKS